MLLGYFKVEFVCDLI